MVIRRAKKEDLPQIDALMNLYGLMTISPEHINKRDVSLVAETQDKLIIGFLWMGVMAKNTLGYIDKVTVHRDYNKQGISQKLFKALTPWVKRLGIQQILGFIRQDEFHNQSVVNALKMAVTSDGYPYTHVLVSVPNTLAELNLEK